MISESCGQRFSDKKFTLEELHISLYKGVGSSGGCLSSGSDFCIRFDDIDLWKRLDRITGAHMTYSATYVWPTIQQLLPFSIGFCAISIFIHGFFFAILDHTKKTAFRIQFLGVSSLLICGILISISQILSVTSDLQNPEIWKKFFLYEESRNMTTKTSSYFNNTSGHASLCYVVNNPEGSALATSSLCFTFFLAFIVAINGCGGLSCCAMCVEDDDSEESLYEDSCFSLVDTPLNSDGTEALHGVPHQININSYEFRNRRNRMDEIGIEIK